MFSCPLVIISNSIFVNCLDTHKKMEEDQTPEHNTSLPSLSPNLTIIPSCRTQPTVHPVSDAPLCAQCRDLQLAFFDPQCPGCWSLAQDTKRSVGELFAIVRQWVPQVQRSLCAISQEVRSTFSQDQVNSHWQKLKDDQPLVECLVRGPVLTLV